MGIPPLSSTLLCCFFLSFLVASALSFNVSRLSFEDGFSPLFGDANLVRSSDRKSVRLLLNRFTGSGFISSSLYNHGLFSASIKLPSDYTAGVVVAFYTSNGDIFEKTHDELDFEFLGNIEGKEWRVQTNVYGNGSTSRGREERYLLWFDPTKEFHRYSILWTDKNIVFYIDEVPIREVVRKEEMGGDYPSKPMSIYATIWDGSPWATSGGRYRVNYKYAPFVSEFTDLVLHGCSVDPIQQLPSSKCADLDASISSADYAVITPERRLAMRKFREKYVTYSYCYDTLRYPATLPECVVVPSEKQRFKDSGHLKFSTRHRRHRRSKRQSRIPLGSSGSEASI